ncbi:MAG: hypothetical protein M3Y39_16065 [Chloroflexota bacterium]|nr:hypothetical protein [Chloroflexota bacterium]
MTTQIRTTSLIPIAPALNEPTLDHIQLGHITISNDNQMFLTALGYGIEAYCECDFDKRQMSAQELLDMLLETVLDERDDLTGKRVSYSWRIGFLVGQVAGMLHPDLVDTDPTQTYLEALFEKCARLYPEGE